MRSATWLATLGAALGAQALSTEEWQKQSIYQVLTDRFARTDLSTDACANLNDYCGGTWQGIISKLDYIQNMGFTAIWISPIVKNLEGYSTDGSGYHGYWAQDIYSLNANFGTAEDLKQLSAELHNRGMYLMVDVVTNHMGYLGCGDCVDYSVFHPFGSQDYYHPFCLIDYADEDSVRNCWMGSNTVSLPDLRTEDADVQAEYNRWVADLIATYGIDGLRADSVLEVGKDFWANFSEAAGQYIVGETYDGDPAIFPDWLNYLPGVMNYAQFYWVQRAFQSSAATMGELLDGVNTMKGQMATGTLGTFLENHDQARFPSLTADVALIKNAIAFTVLADGIPIVYYGQEQQFGGGSTPDNREALWTTGWDTSHELYGWIASLNQIRNQAVYAAGDGYVGYQAVPTSPDGHTLALRKGPLVSVHTNVGSGGGAYAVTLGADFTGFAAGQALTEVMGCTTTTTTADGSGALAFDMGPTTKVFVPSDLIAGSGICGGK
ncbi:glycoside hydrolase family 13 protein [Xylariomycetidae sp. FL0641]|nr:glycoside hydrolase family 13 protein [Xylariomycetidae sp. FL0641]